MAVRGSISAVREETMVNNAGKQAKIPPSMQPWIEARKRFRLSHAHVQMARELGLGGTERQLAEIAGGSALKLSEALRSLRRRSKPRSKRKRRPDPPYRSSRNRIPLRKTRCRMSLLNAQLRNSSKFGVLGDWARSRFSKANWSTVNF